MLGWHADINKCIGIKTLFWRVALVFAVNKESKKSLPRKVIAFESIGKQ